MISPVGERIRYYLDQSDLEQNHVRTQALVTNQEGLRCWTRRTIEFTGIYGVVKPNEIGCNKGHQGHSTQAVGE